MCRRVNSRQKSTMKATPAAATPPRVSASVITLTISCIGDPKPIETVGEKRRCIQCLLKVTARCVVIAGRRKSTVYVCPIRLARASPLRRLAKWECPRSPAATAQRICFRTIELMLFDRGHAKDVSLLGELFFGVVPFLSY